MYTLFIVDDEEVVRKGIRELLQNTDCDYVICGEAADGELALPMVQELKPDILLTDIKMPFMDGLELCKVIRQKMPWIHILILSGMDEFEYARAAISLGVDEYILKPFTMPQLLNSLAGITRKIEEERASYFSLSGYGLGSTQKRRGAQERFFNDILDENYSAAETLLHAEKLGLNLAARQYLVCCLDIGSGSEVPTVNLRRQFGILLERTLDGREDMFWAPRGDQFVILIKATSDAEGILEVAYEAAQALQHEFKRMIGANLSVGIGSVVFRLSEISMSYHNAKRSLGGLSGHPHGSILSTSDLEHGLIPRFDFTEVIPLADRLRHVTTEDLDFLLEHHFGSSQSADSSSLLYRYCLYADLIVTSLRLLQSLGIKENKFLQDASTGESMMRAAATYETTITSARELLEKVVQQRDEKQGVRYGGELRRAKEYIRQHYMDNDLSLNTIAAEVGFSPNHFSTVFSQQMGQTFVEYLTEFRIEEGKRLLRESDMKLSDIAYAIGYNEPHYFSYIFKKHTGISPSMYRKQCE